MATPGAVRPSLLALVLFVILLLVVAACAAPVVPQGPQFDVLDDRPALIPEEYLFAYFGVDAAELRAKSWEKSDRLLNDDSEQGIAILDAACRTAVLVGEEDYKTVYGVYEAPVFWTFELNFSQRVTDVVAPGTIGEPFVACLRLHWRDEGRQAYVPSSRKIDPEPAAGAGTEKRDMARGVPFLCYTLSISDTGGSVSVEPKPTATYTTPTSKTATLDLNTARFSEGAFLYCPVDIAGGMHAYVYGGHKAPLPVPDPAFQAEISQTFGISASAFISRVVEHIAARIQDGTEDQHNVIAVAGTRNLPRDEGLHPVMDYLSGCSQPGQCGFGFRMGYTVTASSPMSFTMDGDFTLNGRAATPSQAPVSRLAVGRLQRCELAWPTPPDSPYPLIADGGFLAMGGAPVPQGGEGRAAGAAQGTPEECAALNWVPSSSSEAVRLWIGPSHLFIGYRPGVRDRTYTGELDYVWFDPDQHSPDPGK